MTGRARGARAAAARILHLLLPPACHGCDRPMGPRADRLCDVCATRLRQPAHPRCPRCHAPRGTGVDPDRPCPECVGWPELLRGARAAALLASPADGLVHGLKYGGWAELAPFMARKMVRVLPTSKREMSGPLVPVPTTPARRKARGYNQAELLARALAPHLDARVAGALERREGHTTQTALHRNERQENVRGAFRPVPGAEAEVRGRAVLLVDDVLTTGATAGAATEVLGAMGATSVFLVTFARSLPDDDA